MEEARPLSSKRIAKTVTAVAGAGARVGKQGAQEERGGGLADGSGTPPAQRQGGETLTIRAGTDN